jgi:hypothetical protein
VFSLTLSTINAGKITTKMNYFENDGVIVKETKNYDLEIWKSKKEGAYPTNKIYVKIFSKEYTKKLGVRGYIYTPKLKKTQNGGKLITKSETYKITICKQDSFKVVKKYNKTLKPGQKLKLKIPKNSWVFKIDVIDKYSGKW